MDHFFLWCRPRKLNYKHNLNDKLQTMSMRQTDMRQRTQGQTLSRNLHENLPAETPKTKKREKMLYCTSRDTLLKQAATGVQNILRVDR